jgi:hypothetical protein
MKTNKILMLVLLLSTTLFSAMCSSDDGPNSSNNIQDQIDQVENTAVSGSWVITYFFDTDQEETSNYNGYSFDFAANGVLTATNVTNTYTGTWSVTDDSNSMDDSSSDDDIDFNIFFSTPEDFAELSDDWDIISHTSTQIKLIDVSGGNGGTDYLTFVKQ